MEKYKNLKTQQRIVNGFWKLIRQMFRSQFHKNNSGQLQMLSQLSLLLLYLHQFSVLTQAIPPTPIQLLNVCWAPAHCSQCANLCCCCCCCSINLKQTLQPKPSNCRSLFVCPAVTSTASVSKHSERPGSLNKELLLRATCLQEGEDLKGN